eukprot:TRINITY_DN13519_c0_g1_i1.p2 TRINITY_DN13519_c0_g1~~TRINITY_DN13519_c0_g1_i1.p2  ORF type:complete len:183 (+),score=39.73 TRINITY_DN13519_c0_g1_i1:1219-1767(+)
MNDHQRIRKAMIQHLSQDVWCRIGPGSFGVGVIAVRDIPEGQVVDKVPGNTMPRHMRETAPSIKVRMDQLKRADPDVVSYLKELNVVSNGIMSLSCHGANCFIGLAPFINHSDPPADNCCFVDDVDDDIAFSKKVQTTRFVKKGEELFANYLEYLTPAEMKELPGMEYLVDREALRADREKK